MSSPPSLRRARKQLTQKSKAGSKVSSKVSLKARKNSSLQIEKNFSHKSASPSFSKRKKGAQPDIGSPFARMEKRRCKKAMKLPAFSFLEKEVLLAVGSGKPFSLKQFIEEFPQKNPGKQQGKAPGALQLQGVIRKLLEDQILVSRGKSRSHQPRFSLHIDYCVGPLEVHSNGKAHLLNPDTADLPIAKEELETGLHGDWVLAKKEVVPFKSRGHRYGERGSSPLARHYRGRVLAVLKRARSEFTGTLQRDAQGYYVAADDPNLGEPIRLQEKKLRDWPQIGNKVLVRMGLWENRHLPAEGTLLENLGKPDRPEVAMLSLIHKHSLPQKFPEEVLEEATSFGQVLHSREIEGRLDLRHRPVITIDPDDARDFDDAIEVEALPDGWRASIHIADVAHYVTPGSRLDEEARARGNSTYLVDRVLPMLPQVLSNGLCSLLPDQDRLTLSVIATLDREGNLQEAELARSVIHSSQRLTYQEALQLLQDSGKEKKKKEEKDLKVHLQHAWACAEVLRNRRMAQGAINLEMPELKVRLDEQGKPIRLETVEHDHSHQLIEELMLLANEVVAKKLWEASQPTLYRVHEEPHQSKLIEYRDLVISYGISIGNLSDPHQIEELFQKIEGEPYEHVLKVAFLRSMQKACYAPRPIGHYGLKKTYYTHFTSPIRRYADLVVHRSLLKLLGENKYGPDARQLEDLGTHLSERERLSLEGERESIQMKKIDYLELLSEEDSSRSWGARILEVRRYGLMVEVPELLLHGMISVDMLDPRRYLLDLVRAQLIDKHDRRSFRAGDFIAVQTAHVDRWKQQVNFRLS